MPPNQPSAGVASVPSLQVALCRVTTLTFGAARFEVQLCGSRLHISRDADNFAILTLKDQRVAYKVQLLGSVVLEEAVTGVVDWRGCFSIEWEDEHAAPELVFKRPPTGIVRSYARGQAIELGLEPVSQYEVRYTDGVEALFERGPDQGFTFRFSTGFAGSFWKEPDGAWVLRFRGNRLSAEDDGSHAQSKFLVSRSKFTDNLLLYMQEDAQVTLR
ncbi:MAG: hypothetical protein ABIO70_13850 [Pseudomonadota bacterium]